MSAGIIAGIDKGIVGNTEVYGKTWHGLKEYAMIDGPVSLALAEETISFPAAKAPLYRMVGGVLTVIPNMFALVRTDSEEILHPQSVTDEYEVYQNAEFIQRIREHLLSVNPDATIDSAGTLFGGKFAFVSFILDAFTYDHDVSVTVQRMMLKNAFGGGAITGCLNETRVVCANTMRAAEAQGKVNESLAKFRHTREVRGRVADHVIRLAEIHESARIHREKVNSLTTVPMTVADVTNFLAALFPVPTGDTGKGKTITRRTNKQDAVRAIFETATDLQGDIGGTRFAMLNAVTNYSQHDTVTKSLDEAFAWHDVALGEGPRDKVNQSALDLLLTPTISGHAPVMIPA